MRENESLAEAYLKRINDRLGIKTHLGGEDTRSGVVSDALGHYIGHLFPSMSMMYSAIYTAYCFIEEFEKVQKHKMNELENKAHYWDKWGKTLYEKQQKRLQTNFDKKEAKRIKANE